jgi:hypothetical protein
MAGAARRTFWLSGVGLLAVATTMILSRRTAEMPQEQPKSTPAVSAPVIEPPSPETLAAPHLAAADAQCAAIVDRHAKSINAFFDEAKRNTPAFSEAALSWASKWRLIADYTPFTKGGRHEVFIRNKFEEHVFSRNELEVAVTRIVKSYLTQVRSIESRMLVDLRTDVAGFPETYLRVGSLDDSRLQQEYDQALSRSMDATGSRLSGDIGSQLVSVITGEVLAQVAVRMGVSAGILGTGAASSWTTLGIGLVVGVIVDQIIAWIWNWWADPKGDLASELNAKLDSMNRLLREGLRVRLQDFAEERAQLRRQTVLALLRPQE